MALKIKNILVSQPRPTTGKSAYFDMEAEFGVQVHWHPFIRVEEFTPKEFRAQHINILDYTAIIFNSQKGIDHFFNLCKEMRVKIPESMHYYCVSETVANYLQRYIQFRKRKVFFGPNNKMEELVPPMLRRPKDKFLMILSDVHTDADIQMFASHKIEVKPAIMYRTVSNMLSEEMKAVDYDMFVLFTPAGVRSFLENYPDFKQGERAIVAFGNNTTQALEAAGLRVDIHCSKGSSITAAINAFLEENHKQ